jgi:hypothetical protein
LGADMPQPLFASTGVFNGNHPHVDADLLAALKPCGCSDDQRPGQSRKRPHATLAGVRWPQRELAADLSFGGGFYAVES